MTREQAASLLGIGVDADDDAIRRAWRLWAKVAHPDTGGDAAHFARLDQARQVLLQSSAHHEPGTSAGAASVPVRPGLRAVVRRPSHPAVLAFTGLAACSAAALPHVLPANLHLVVAATPAALAAAAWTIVTERCLLTVQADRGHRIALMMVLWLPLIVGQLLLSTLLTPSLLPVLPLLALPIVAVVAIVNLPAAHWGLRFPDTQDGPQ